MSDDMASKEDRDDGGENELFLVLKGSLCCRSCAAGLRVTAVYKQALRAEERKVPCLPAGPAASAKRSSQLPALLSEQRGRHQEGWCLSRASSVLPGSSPTGGSCCHFSCPLGPQQPPGRHQLAISLLRLAEHRGWQRDRCHSSSACRQGPSLSDKLRMESKGGLCVSKQPQLVRTSHKKLQWKNSGRMLSLLFFFNGTLCSLMMRNFKCHDCTFCKSDC